MQKEQIIMALKRASIIKQTEGGRSMVEMLGVLAVTGVLAVVGIMGFQNAMANIPEGVGETVADMGWQLPLSVKIGETVLTADTCGEDNTINFNFAPDLSMVATGGTSGGDNTEGGNNTDALSLRCHR